MREPTTDRHETWERFYQARSRRIDEIAVVYETLPPWKRSEADTELKLLWFELDYAGRELGESCSDDERRNR